MFSIQKILRLVLAVVSASAAALQLTAPASARADDMYAAIAFSAKADAWGIGNHVDSREKAEQAALAECKSDDAQVVVWVKSGYCAVAVGANNKYGIGFDKDANTARKTAIAEYLKSTGNDKFQGDIRSTHSNYPAGASNIESIPVPTTLTELVRGKEPGGDAPPPAAADDPEKELARLINAYRAANDLPAVPVSKKLTLVAETHARDCAAHPGQGMHDWSQSDKWTGGAFGKNPHIMWDKPKEIADYPSAGYENAAGGGDKITAQEALKLWKGDAAHNDVILNKGIWKDMTWKAMGVGIYKGNAHLWFGTDADPDAP